MAKKITWQDLLNAANIKNYIEGNWNYFKEQSGFLALEKHLQEQAMYRAWLCQECYKEGSCLICGCTTPNLFYAPQKEDAGEKWGKMLDKHQWEVFKKENNIDVEDLKLPPKDAPVQDMAPWEIKELLQKQNWEEDETER